MVTKQPWEKLTLSASQRLRKESVGEKVLHMPFRRAFGLPRPKDPASPPLISVQLGLDEVADVVLVVRRQACHGTSVLAGAASNIRATAQTTVISSTPAKAIQPFSAVRLSTGPFADNGPLVAVSELVGAEGTGGGDVLGRALRHLTLIKDLVRMGVKHDVIDSGLLIHETVPIVDWILEGVMNHDSCVAVAVADGAPAIVVEFLDGVEVQRKAERLVQKLYGSDHVGVGGVALSKTTDSVEGLGDGVPPLPVDRTVTATVIEAVLRARC